MERRYLPDPTGEFVARATRAEDFKPIASYDPDGDQIEVILTLDNFYARQVTPSITVYCRMGTDEVVGICLDNVTAMMPRTV